MYALKKLIPIIAGLLTFALFMGLMGQVQAQTVEDTIRQNAANFESVLTFSATQNNVIINVLTLGYAAHAAGLVYFLATLGPVAPRYRLTGILSAVVMVSAFLELFRLEADWRSAFVFNGQFFEIGTDTFSNGFRYMNWSIDVPMLLLQLVVLLGLTRGRAITYATQFIIGGLLMIYTGYVGQFYEVTSLPWFFIWGGISTVFYIYILIVVWQLISSSVSHVPQNVRGLTRSIPWYILITWTIYPIAYVIPAFWFAPWGAVTRQILFTIADITSKVIYGAILTYIARKRSEAIDYEPAIAISRR